MRFDGGWVRKWRSLDDGQHWVSKNVFAYAIFHRLIAWANYEPTKVLRHGKFIEIPRGSLITSTRDLARSFAAEGFDRRTADRYLKLLEIDGMIAQQVSHRGRIITICNYDKYQKKEDSPVPPNDPLHVPVHVPVVAQSWPTPCTRIQEVKNLRSEEVKNLSLPSDFSSGDLEPKIKKKAPKIKLIPSDEFLALGKDWLEFAKKEMPWKIKDPKWTDEDFGNELQRIAAKIGAVPSGMKEIFEWIKADDFWRKNAVSPFGLLKKSSKNDLRKIDNIIGRMRTKAHREMDAALEFINSPSTLGKDRPW